MLDKTDRRILALLKTNARLSHAEIGRRINMSRTGVNSRVRMLEANGIISGYQAIISDDGRKEIEAILFVQIAERPCEKALNWLRELDDVDDVKSISGNFDAIVMCRVSDVSELAALNDRIGANDLIKTSTSSIVLSSN